MVGHSALRRTLEEVCWKAETSGEDFYIQLKRRETRRDNVLDASYYFRTRDIWSHGCFEVRECVRTGKIRIQQPDTVQMLSKLLEQQCPYFLVEEITNTFVIEVTFHVIAPNWCKYTVLWHSGACSSYWSDQSVFNKNHHRKQRPFFTSVFQFQSQLMTHTNSLRNVL